MLLRLSLGKNSEEREGKGGGGERACRQTFEAAIPPSCNYPAVGKLTGNERNFAPSENRVKWSTNLIVNFAKSR